MSKTRPRFQAESIIKTWPMVRLGDVCTIEFGTRVRRKDSQGGDYPVYGGGGATFCWSTYNREDQCIVSRFAMSEECVRFVKGKFFLNDSGLSVRSDNQDLSQTYLDWVLYSKQPEIYALGRGAAQKNLDVEQFVDMMLPLPPLSVQREIVARLERELAAVEKMKKGFEIIAETAKAEFKAELKEVFEEISRGGAEMRRLGDVCDVRDGTHDTPVKCDKGYLLLTSKNVRNGKVDKANAYYISASDYTSINKRSGVDRWDVLFSMIGTVGETAIVDKTPDFAIKNMGLFKTHANELLARWIKYYFDSQLAKQLILDRMKGSNQKFLSLGTLREFPLTLTNRDSMIRLVARLDGAKAKAEKLESKAREGEAVCETMRKAILKEAFE